MSPPVTAADLYGKGLSFPVRVGLDGGLVLSEGELNVRESICLILRTGLQERVERPSFGCRLDSLLFEPNDLASLRLIQEEVTRSITAWEPRVRLNDVRVATNPGDVRAVDITVVYTLVAAGQQDRVDVTATPGS